MMNTGLSQGVCQNLQFPSGAARLSGDVAQRGQDAEITAQPVDLADCSGSWYHAAAIQDANNERDHKCTWKVFDRDAPSK
jgi:hypothetical protein